MSDTDGGAHPETLGESDLSGGVLGRIDLNLLKVFYAVMSERNVTRAAGKLAMTQPAVSNALQRLRSIYDDRLFVRSREGVAPTERAIMIWNDIEPAMDTILSAISISEFSAASTRRTFNVAVTDTLAHRAVPAITLRLRQEASFARIHFHLHSDPGSRTLLERGVLDCAVGMFPNPSAGLMYEPLLADDYVCASAKRNRAITFPLSVETFVSFKHILVRQSDSWTGIVDTWMKLQGLQRENVVIVNSAYDAISLVIASDLVSAVPHRFARADPRHDELVLTPLPFATEKIIYKLSWHERNTRDPANTWLRGIIRQTIEDVCGTSSF